MITVCWALNEYKQINREFWKRIICENSKAVWIIVDGSQQGTDIMFNIFQEFEKEKESGNLSMRRREHDASILGKLDEPFASEKGLEVVSGERAWFKVYYERFASPRRLIAVPKISGS